VGRLSPSELAIWRAHFEREKPGHAENWRFAFLASVVLNARFPGSSFSPDDFMPLKPAEEKPQDEAEVERRFQLWAIGANADRAK
jgi:hypothetical protein